MPFAYVQSPARCSPSGALRHRLFTTNAAPSRRRRSRARLPLRAPGGPAASVALPRRRLQGAGPVRRRGLEGSWRWRRSEGSAGDDLEGLEAEADARGGRSARHAVGGGERDERAALLGRAPSSSRRRRRRRRAKNGLQAASRRTQMPDRGGRRRRWRRAAHRRGSPPRSPHRTRRGVRAASAMKPPLVSLYGGRGRQPRPRVAPQRHRRTPSSCRPRRAPGAAAGWRRRARSKQRRPTSAATCGSGCGRGRRRRRRAKTLRGRAVVTLC